MTVKKMTSLTIREKPPWEEWTRPIIHSDLTPVALGVPRVRSEHNCETVEFNWGWWGGRSYWPGIQCRDDVSCSQRDDVLNGMLRENRWNCLT